jgi:hypothetical protein
MHFLFAFFDIFTGFESMPHRWGRESNTGVSPINTGVSPIN